MAIEIVGKKYGSVGLFLNYEGDTIIEVWLQLSLDSTHSKRFKAHSNESSWAVHRVENLYKSCKNVDRWYMINQISKLLENLY